MVKDLRLMVHGSKALKLGDVFKTTSGGTPSRRNPEYYNGTIPWVKSGELDLKVITSTEEKITESALAASSAKVFPKGTLLIALYGATIGKLARLGIDAATNQAVCGIFENSEHSTEYLYWFLFHKRRDLIKAGVGGAQPNISQTILKNLIIPLPPKEVQKQIVSKIEELFSELDKGIEEIKTAQQQLKVYRQAVLKWAFEGKLTNENLTEGELPEGWKLQKIEMVAECLDNKRKPVNKAEREKRSGKIPYYGANGRTGWIDDYLFDEPLILVVEDETFVGRELPFSYKITGKSWVNNHAHILKPKSGVLFDFLNYQLFYYPFLEIVTGTTGRKKLTKKALMNAQLKICSIDEQVRTVEEIERRLSICEKIEGTIKSSIKQAETLRQSILKNVFG